MKVSIPSPTCHHHPTLHPYPITPFNQYQQWKDAMFANFFLNAFIFIFFKVKIMELWSYII